MSGSYRCAGCWAQIRIGEICSCNDVVTKMTDTYDVYCDKCGHLTAVLSHTCEDELAAMREENERLSGEVGDLKVQLHKTFDDWVQMRDKALVWKKWPGEKPEDGRYLIQIVNRKLGNNIDVDFFQRGEWLYHSMKNIPFDSRITHYAEIPRPEGEES